MKLLLAVLISTQLAGCVTLGFHGWVAAHTAEIGEVALVAGAVQSVEGVVINTKTIVDDVKK